MLSFSEALSRCPLVAILRGVKPSEVVEIGQALIDTSFAIIEVPMNSPDPLESIALLVKAFGAKLLVGAGTVTSADEVIEVGEVGGRLIVMPHADAAVVHAAKAGGLYAVPGFATPTEAFAMIAAGADGLKLFPAEANPPKVLKALRAVLPKKMPVLPVGSITPDNMAEFWAAGANGFGLGSALYKTGATPAQVSAAAAQFIAALRKLKSA
ncbi:MAG TPA: 2-dehydro-3-deoxy-6-phosphogalactonate aldolase [Pseudolabrys sp.]|nr:2-dehydro-3-deoxy-6-phosphogalactonate aldolase [Pseudolabrys sp.]